MLVRRTRPSRASSAWFDDAAIGERGERSALGSPRPDRRQQPDPGLLREVLALAAQRQPQLPDDALDERLVAARELLERVEVAVLRGLEQPVPSGRGAAIPDQTNWSCRRMLRTRLGVFLEVLDRRRARVRHRSAWRRSRAGRDERDPGALDAIPVEHPQQARVSMSNHDQTKVRRTQAGRGHAGRDATAHASPAASKLSRLLRANTPGAARRDAPSL